MFTFGSKIFFGQCILFHSYTILGNRVVSGFGTLSLGNLNCTNSELSYIVFKWYNCYIFQVQKKYLYLENYNSWYLSNKQSLKKYLKFNKPIHLPYKCSVWLNNLGVYWFYSCCSGTLGVKILKRTKFPNALHTRSNSRFFLFVLGHNSVTVT